MIARTWHAQATVDGADAYRQHFEGTVLPILTATEGFVAAYVLAAPDHDGRSLTVLTLWDSSDAIKRFAGPDPSNAVVEEDARAVLTSFDTHVDHHDVLATSHASG